jgi:hypothetical protein
MAEALTCGADNGKIEPRKAQNKRKKKRLYYLSTKE